MTITQRLTKKEWDMLLTAANTYEAEPANFEDDADDRRLEALRNAILKIQSRNTSAAIAAARAAMQVRK